MEPKSLEERADALALRLVPCWDGCDDYGIRYRCVACATRPSVRSKLLDGALVTLIELNLEQERDYERERAVRLVCELARKHGPIGFTGSRGLIEDIRSGTDPRDG